MAHTLYRLTFPNGKLYFGITKHSVERRWKRHQQCAAGSSRLRVHSAIRKYGASTVTVDTLCIGHESYIKDLEVKMIAMYKTQFDGYNATAGGDGARGVAFPKSHETRRRLREANLGKRLPESTKQKLRETWERKRREGSSHKSEETKQRMRDSWIKREYRLTDKHKQSLSAAWERRRKEGRDKASSEARQKISEGLKRYHSRGTNGL